MYCSTVKIVTIKIDENITQSQRLEAYLGSFNHDFAFFGPPIGASVLICKFEFINNNA